MEFIQKIFNFFVAIYQWFIGLPWEGIFYFFRYVFIVLDIVLVIAFIYVFMKTLEYRPKFVFAPTQKRAKKKMTQKNKELIEQWRVLMEKAAGAPPESLTAGIIEADSFVGDVLKNKINLVGETMAERLEKLGNYDLKNLPRLWRAHRIRNDIVHTPGFVIDPIDAKNVLDDYSAFLKEIGVL